MNKLLASTCLLIALFALRSSASDLEVSASVREAQEQRVAAVEKASRSTVGVFGADDAGGGSGVIISTDGYVLTNFHVSSPFGHRMRCGLNDGKMYEAMLVGIDPTGDLALLKMFGRDDFPAATIFDSDKCEIGQWCFAIGNPFLLNTNLQPTVSFGLISGVHRYQYPSGTILEYSDCLQTDAAINPGNSGGPLFNAAGDLIGINGRCSFEKRGRVNVGVGYSISINQAMNFLGELKSGRIVDHATFGFTVVTDEDGKVTVSNILETSDAFRRGLKFQDRIVSFAGYKIQTVNQLKNYMGIFPAGWRLPLVYEQDGKTIETYIRLASLHRADELDALAHGKSPTEMQPPDEPEKKQGEETDEVEEAKDEYVDPIADYYIAKANFGNAFFNQVELDRISKLQEDQGDWQDTAAAVNIIGSIAGEPTPVSFKLSDNLVESTIGESKQMFSDLGTYSTAVNSQELSSIAVGLQVWRLWHAVGPKLLGDCVYIGTAPILQREGLFDKTRIVFEDLVLLVYSNVESGDIELIEMEADATNDPAEVYFSKYERKNDRRVPTIATLQFGLDPKLTVSLDQWDSVSSNALPEGAPK